MPFVNLHDHMNPNRVVPLVAEEISGVTPFASGSTVYRKGCDQVICVHETPEEVEALVNEALGR